MAQETQSPKWTIVGSCEVCGGAIWTQQPVDGGAPPSETFKSCDCERLIDPVNKPIPAPPLDPKVAACLAQGGHVAAPKRWPNLPWSQDATRNSMVYETVPCLRCRVNLVLEHRHVAEPPKDWTILQAPQPKAQAAMPPLRTTAA